MAYLYKTIMRRENHAFDLCQNRCNSKETIIVAVPKSNRNDHKFLGVIQNKTGKIVIMDRHNFKDKTIEELKAKCHE